MPDYSKPPDNPIVSFGRVDLTPEQKEEKRKEIEAKLKTEASRPRGEDKVSSGLTPQDLVDSQGI